MNIWAVLKLFLIKNYLIDKNSLVQWMYQWSTLFLNKCISEKDYLHAIDVWIMFKMKIMGKFISTCLEYYQLDPCPFF